MSHITCHLSMDGWDLVVSRDLAYLPIIARPSPLDFATAFKILHKYPLLPRLFLFFFLSSSYLPCLGDCDQQGGSPQTGPCIAHRGGTVCSMVLYGSLTGVFFGTLHSWNSFFSSSFEPLARGWRRDLACIQRSRQ